MGHGIINWFKTGKRVQSCILSALLLSACLLTSLKSISCEMLGWRNHIKIARRNNNSPRHTDTTVMPETEEELKNLLMRVKEESENTGLKVNFKQN